MTIAVLFNMIQFENYSLVLLLVNIKSTYCMMQVKFNNLLYYSPFYLCLCTAK